MRLFRTTELARRAASAVTLLELMVAMTLLSVIILGLYSMFDRTQQSFQASTTQKDVMEQGRAVMEIIARELEQMVSLGQTNSTNIWANQLTNDHGAGYTTEFTQSRPDGSIYFTNSLQEIFFYTRQTNWRAIAYVVTEASTNRSDRRLYTNGIGTLKRLEINTNLNRLRDNRFFEAYYLNSTNGGVNNGFVQDQAQHLADGVSHFYIRAYEADGTLVNTNFTGFTYTSNALPAYLEVELGLIEPKILTEIRSISDTNTQRRYLEDTNNIRASHIHLFTQRIPIRNR